MLRIVANKGFGVNLPHLKGWLASRSLIAQSTLRAFPWGFLNLRTRRASTVRDDDNDDNVDSDDDFVLFRF